MLALQHVLALFLFLGVPVWDVFETRALKTSNNPRRKILSYQRLVLILWIAAILGWFILRSQVFFVWPGVHQFMSGNIRDFARGLIGAFAAVFIGINLLRAFSRRNTKLRETTVAALGKLDFFLPATHEERTWFAAAAITAGICEEILYRGFLIRYLSDGPWHFGLALAVVASSVFFGLGHGYQGVSGIITTGVVGAVMAILFLATGGLWVPMVLHAFIDLNVLFLLRRLGLPPG
jgi:membrane protease YdiL (CAAX protease family)